MPRRGLELAKGESVGAGFFLGREPTGLVTVGEGLVLWNQPQLSSQVHCLEL